MYTISSMKARNKVKEIEQMTGDELISQYEDLVDDLIVSLEEKEDTINDYEWGEHIR